MILKSCKVYLLSKEAELLRFIFKFRGIFFSWGFLLIVSISISGCGLISDADEKFYFGDTQQPTDLEYQYLGLANEIDSVKPCYLIHPQSLRRGAFAPPGNQVALLRSLCFAAVAGNTGNEQLCEKVRSASTLFASGANLNTAACREVARINQGSIITRISYSLDVPSIVSVAGYSDEEIDAYLVSENRFSSVDAAIGFRQVHASTYWNEVRMTLLHTEQFFDRITQMPGFGTILDQGEMNNLIWTPRQQRLWTPPEGRTHSVPELRLPAESDR